MDGMTGSELAAQLRAQGFRGFVAVLTGDAADATRRSCLAAGADEVCVKPLRKKALLDMPIMKLYA